MHGGGGFAVEGARLFGGRHPLVPDSMMTAAQLDRIKRATEPAARLEITQDCPEMAFEIALEIALEIAPREGGERAERGRREIAPGLPSAGALPASCTCRSPAPTMGG